MTETCVCCGAEIPEGRQVCPSCEKVREDFALELIYNGLTGEWEEHKEPFATVEFPTEEDYNHFCEILAFWNEHRPKEVTP